MLYGSSACCNSVSGNNVSGLLQQKQTLDHSPREECKQADTGPIFSALEQTSALRGLVRPVVILTSSKYGRPPSQTTFSLKEMCIWLVPCGITEQQYKRDICAEDPLTPESVTHWLATLCNASKLKEA